MNVERWILPPAIAAAVFTVVAIAPPGGAPARGLRVEIAEAPVPGRPLAVRVAVEMAGGPGWHAPAHTTVELRNAHGVVMHSEPRRAGGSTYAWAAETVAGAGPYQLTVHADDLVASTPLAEGSSAAPTDGAEQTAGANGIDLVLEGRALVPEVPTALLVRVLPAPNEAIMLASTDPAVTVAPERVAVDACGVALTMLTLHGFDATLLVEVPGDPPRHARRRLPVALGALGVLSAPGSLSVNAAMGGQTIFVLAGDARGPTDWTAARLPDVPDGYSHASVPLPPRAQWAIASLSPSFEPATGIWVQTPPAVRCAATTFGARFARAAAVLPAGERVRLVFDGAADAQRERHARQTRARVMALALAALAIAMLIALVLHATLAADPAQLRSVSATARQRLAWALAGSAILLIGGLVLLTTFVLRL